MLDDAVLRDMIIAAADLGLFALVEAFDRQDLARCGRLLEDLPQASRESLLFGLNTRDLRDLGVHPERLAELIDAFPRGYRRIAESGLEDEHDVRCAAEVGYDGVLMGTSLMRATDPTALCRALVAAGRQTHAALNAQTGSTK